jgi:hypothetical protein
VLKPEVSVPVEVVPGTMSPATEKAAVETADTAPAADAGRVLIVVLAASMFTLKLVPMDTVYFEAGWELPMV